MPPPAKSSLPPPPHPSPPSPERPGEGGLCALHSLPYRPHTKNRPTLPTRHSTSPVASLSAAVRPSGSLLSFSSTIPNDDSGLVLSVGANTHHLSLRILLLAPVSALPRSLLEDRRSAQSGLLHPSRASQ
ncbi:hypothetical protein FA13DRAFT_1073647 [Coprinellus micaceus]|uniref:Uncharacterized protein n=1 Tax=Coprinellus micaceus TaxID=71717 RepID=A0A4Y7TR16_COPMI|nr:hypothetical protein FA13DRAFT_1073647 [Coprinellus micaceus]